MRSTWVLGDPHAGADPEADRALLLLLDRAAAGGVDLLVMGDLFVAWIAVDRFLTDLQRAVLGRMEAIRAGGGTIRFVVGNRDYLPERMIGRAFDAVHADETVIDLDGVPTMIVHGDRLNPRDRPYRAWYRLSRSAPVSAILARLPRMLGRSIAAEIETRMRGMNAAYKTGPLPLDGIEALARRARAAGAARALVGHFHEPARIEAAVPVVVAPGWFVHRTVLLGRDLSSYSAV